MSAPYIPFYIDDFDGATAHLTPEEEGVYMRLLKLAWRSPGCSLPDDPALIARKIRLTNRDYARVGERVLKEFFQLSRGRWTQSRLKTEWVKLENKNRERSEAGRKGGKAKALKNLEKSSSKARILLKQPEPEPEPEPKPYSGKKEEGSVTIFCARGKNGAEAIVTRRDGGGGRIPDWQTQLAEAGAAAGDMFDQTQTGTKTARELTALIQPSAGQPCDWDLDVIPAIVELAARQRRKAKPIGSWVWVRPLAIENRDRRLNGVLPEVAVMAEAGQGAFRGGGLGEQISRERQAARDLALKNMAEQRDRAPVVGAA